MLSTIDISDYTPLSLSLSLRDVCPTFLAFPLAQNFAVYQFDNIKGFINRVIVVRFVLQCKFFHKST